ncbi:MAG: hypothetical protein J2P18_19035 [Nocardia sp.]|nr:hypothetical protein [Nocardia sp.]
MKRTAVGTALVGMGLAVAGAALAPQASAYPAGPYGIEGPCAGKDAAHCIYGPSADGLTWTFHVNSQNYDKQGNFVCWSSALYCDPLMGIVRAAPPAAIGPMFPH